MENKHLANNYSKTLDLVQVALMAAIVCVATMVIKVPTFIGFTHLGDSMVFLSVFLLGKRKAVAASGIGMCLADILSGYAYYAPFTLVIKAIMALIVAAIAYRGEYDGNNMYNNAFACIIGGLWMVVAYFFAGSFISTYMLFKTGSFYQGMIMAAGEVPGNLIQAAVGMIIAIPLGKLLRKTINMK